MQEEGRPEMAKPVSTSSIFSTRMLLSLVESVSLWSTVLSTAALDLATSVSHKTRTASSAIHLVPRPTSLPSRPGLSVMVLQLPPRLPLPHLPLPPRQRPSRHQHRHPPQTPAQSKTLSSRPQAVMALALPSTPLQPALPLELRSGVLHLPILVSMSPTLRLATSGSTWSRLL